MKAAIMTRPISLLCKKKKIKLTIYVFWSSTGLTVLSRQRRNEQWNSSFLCRPRRLGKKNLHS